VTVTADDNITLTVDDNGVGAEKFAREGGHGVMNLHERARMLGGSASLTTLDPHGTRLEWRVPSAE